MKETNTTNSGTSKTNSPASSYETSQSGIYHGGIPIGFDVKAGVDWDLTKTIGLYADVNLRGLNWTPTHYSLKTHSTNGVDDFASLSTYYKEIDYKKSIDSRQTISQDSHQQQLRQTDPFTGVGLDIGIKINLGKWERW